MNEKLNPRMLMQSAPSRPEVWTRRLAAFLEDTRRAAASTLFRPGGRLLFLSLLCPAVFAAPAPPLPVIPQPAQITATGEDYPLTATTLIAVSSPRFQPQAEFLRDALAIPTGLRLSIAQNPSSPRGAGTILLTTADPADPELGPEGYRFRSSSAGVVISANTETGIFYGIQTLLQLMPPEVESLAPVRRASWPVAGADIADHPRFPWRGLMIDLADHFYDKRFVESELDQMAKYKLNVLHLHLTDSSGWRVEIKSLPRLTEVGAWRAAKVFDRKVADRAYPEPGLTGPREGGFYTQEDIREMVAYARARGITIVPEIDVPGHSYALIAAYPELSCTGRLASTPEEAENDALCPAKEAVYQKLDLIVGEVAALFPGEYIHMGGDEVNMSSWKDSAECRELMRRENLPDLDALRGYFMRRVVQIVEAHGRKLIGWDEMMDERLPKDAAVMSWRGTEGGTAAAKAGHHVVMTPVPWCYLDFPQADPSLEPAAAKWGKHGPVTLRDCYAFDPVPAGIDPKLILGGQGSFWNEWVAAPRHAEYMIWPREIALAEALWTPAENRSWDGFVRRLEPHFARFDLHQINLARSAYEPSVKTDAREPGVKRIQLSTEMPGVDLYYSWDGSTPDTYSAKYSAPFVLPSGTAQLRVAPYRDGKPIGQVLTVPEGQSD